MNFENDFKDKVVIVTGGAGGLGKEAAMRFASSGARVVICDVKTEQGKETSDAISGTGAEATFIETDVSEEVSVV
ncbi:MAG: SDR family NAD(P)-dependent oxidoreductase, partial [Deltaproteobacteria bacterium]|nr:SDR family NAD(P)-dependent oxidoreductase [Deltaproteobacteria bacterium]